ESIVHIDKHFLQSRRHYGEVADVLQLDTAPHCGGAIATVEQEIADTLQINDELEAGQQFAGVLLVHLGDDRGYSLIDEAIERVEFLLALPDPVRQRRYAGGDSLSDNAGGNAGHPTSLQGLLSQLCADH